MVSPKVFISIDGDDVGRRLEKYVVLEQVGELKEFSSLYKNAMKWLSTQLKIEFHSDIIFSEGDSVIAHSIFCEQMKKKLDKIKSDFYQMTGCTISIGFGVTLREAYLALKIAKLNGKNQIQEWGNISDE